MLCVTASLGHKHSRGKLPGEQTSSGEFTDWEWPVFIWCYSNNRAMGGAQSKPSALASWTLPQQMVGMVQNFVSINTKKSSHHCNKASSKYNMSDVWTGIISESPCTNIRINHLGSLNEGCADCQWGIPTQNQCCLYSPQDILQRAYRKLPPNKWQPIKNCIIAVIDQGRGTLIVQSYWRKVTHLQLDFYIVISTSLDNFVSILVNFPYVGLAILPICLHVVHLSFDLWMF